MERQLYIGFDRKENCSSYVIEQFLAMTAEEKTELGNSLYRGFTADSFSFWFDNLRNQIDTGQEPACWEFWGQVKGSWVKLSQCEGDLALVVCGSKELLIAEVKQAEEFYARFKAVD